MCIFGFYIPLIPVAVVEDVVALDELYGAGGFGRIGCQYIIRGNARLGGELEGSTLGGGNFPLGAVGGAGAAQNNVYIQPGAEGIIWAGKSAPDSGRSPRW